MLRKRNKREIAELIEKNVRNDKYYDHHGDNYLYKSEWDYTNRKKINSHRNFDWKSGHKWWVKSNDLTLHNGLKAKNINKYEQRTNPNYFKDYHEQIYKYDNPIGYDLDKYNDQNYETTTAGYTKDKKTINASIHRKRKSVF